MIKVLAQAVPLMDCIAQRDVLSKYHASKGIEGIAVYQRKRNAPSPDRFDAGLPESLLDPEVLKIGNGPIPINSGPGSAVMIYSDTRCVR